jgi:hypothetical protein
MYPTSGRLFEKREEAGKVKKERQSRPIIMGHFIINM